jgi:FlgD Ig-like domain
MLTYTNGIFVWTMGCTIMGHILGFFRSNSSQVYKKIYTNPEYILYDLNWNVGHQTTINNNIYTVIGKGFMNVFGVPSLQYIELYTGDEGSWTTRTYSEIFGQINSDHWDYMSQWNSQTELTGAQINGTIYGSIVSNDNSLIQPGSILYQNHPNPFNPSTTIAFSIQNDSKIDLSIFNIKGQKIKSLAQNDFAKGSHSIIWNGDDDSGKPVSSGIYYYKLNVSGRTEAVKKCLLLK